MTDADPRRRRSRERVLDAAWQLFDRDGLDALTVERIATHSGVAKTTVYRQWPNKTAVLADALLVELEPRTPFPDTGSVHDDLRAQLAAVIELLRDSPAGAAYLTLVARSQDDPMLAAQLRDRYLTARRAEAVALLERGVDGGELPRGTDAGVVVDALYGALYYRFLVLHADTDTAYADALLTQVLPRRTPRASEPD